MIKIYINNEEVVCNKKFTIHEEFLNPSSVILPNVYPFSWETTKDYTSTFYSPLDYSSCKILRDDVLYFCGLTKNSGNIALNPRYPKYADLQIIDYKTLLSECKTLDFVISNKTISEAIALVIDSITDYGFELGNINILNDETIGAYSTLDKTPYDVFQYLAEISQSRWTTRIIDEDTTAIDFYDPTLIPAASDIDYTTSYWKTNQVVDMTWNFATNDYRNKQSITSDLVYGNVEGNETFLSNGYSRTYQTEQMIGIVSHIYVDSVEKSIATNTQQEQGYYADFYYTPGEKSFQSNPNNEVYAAGSVINIIYTPLIKGRQTSSNYNEIARINAQTGRNGNITRYENRNDLITTDELTQVANAYIKYKGKPEITLTIITHNVDILNVGQQVHFNIPSFATLDTDYLVKIKETEINQTGADSDIFYTYQLSSNFDADTYINYFDNQRRKLNGNIGESEYITRNIDLENTANVNFKEFTATEFTPDGDNILDCTLNSPFTN